MSYYGNPSGGGSNSTGGGGGGGGGDFYGAQAPQYGFGQQQQQQTPQPNQWMPQPSQQQTQQQQQQQVPQATQQWMPQPQQQMQQQPSAQPVPGYAGAGTGFGAPMPAQMWNPGTAAAATNIAMSMATGDYSNIGMMGKQFFESGAMRMIPGLESMMISLRYYFAVDNQYVLLKMKKVLLPILSKQWKRLQKEPEGPDPNMFPQYGVPKVDENAPDLYIPVMSLITYVLLCAVCYGTSGHFNPEVIPDVTTKCFVTQILEVLAIRFGFYMMQAPIAILDLFSYTGYKYLGLCINMFVGLILGHFGLGSTGYYITFLWTASASSYFMLKTMANNIPAITSAAGPKREVMVLAFAASQFATMWFVSQTKFL